VLQAIKEHSPDVIIIAEAELPPHHPPPILPNYDSFVPRTTGKIRCIMYVQSKLSATQHFWIDGDLPMVSVNVDWMGTNVTVIGIYRQF
jgi:hypothetical protein